MEKDKAYVLHILDEIDSIGAFVAETSFDAFVSDLKTTKAVERSLEIIGEAAKKGISLEGASLYVTHFPCAVCAKFVAYSGIKKVYFREGTSTLDGKAILESADINIVRVPA